MSGTQSLPKEVSCYPFKNVVDSCLRRGATVESLMENLAVPYDTLIDPDEWVDWNSCATFMGNIGKIFTDEELIQIGFESHRTRAGLARLLPYLSAQCYSISDLYHWSMDANTGIAHSGNHCIRTRAVDVAPGHVVIDLQMKEGFPFSREYGVMNAGLLSAFPTFAHRAPATLDLQPIENGIRAEFRFQEHGNPLIWLRQAITWPFRTRAMSRNLSDALSLWQDRYHALDKEVQERTRAENALLTVSAREQERIRQDLHDTVGQELSALNYHAQHLVDMTKNADPVQARIAQDIAVTATRVAGEVRHAIRGLTPVDPYPDGLVLGVQDLVDATQARTENQIDFTEDGFVALYDHQRAAHLYRIVQEALNNAMKYAQADHIAVKLSGMNGSLSVCVQDDGVGMDQESGAEKGMGLTIMQYRANVLGGTLNITSSPGKGTTVACTVPNPRDGRKERPGRD